MPETSRTAGEPAEQLNRLQKRVGALEWQLRATTAISALGATMVGGATLVMWASRCRG